MQDKLVMRRAVAVHRALDGAGVEHAIGGALALGYHVAEPRATYDIDVNLTLDKEEARLALDVLPDGVEHTDADLEMIRRDGQVRLWWPIPDGTRMPLDLFFAEHDFHASVARRVVWVPFLDTDVPVISATDIVVFKALFDRSKDWADIEEVVKYDPPSFSMEEAVRWIGEIVGSNDARLPRLRALEGVEEKPPFRWPQGD